MDSENNNRRECIRSVANAFLNLIDIKLCIENGQFFKSLQNLYPSDYYKQIVEIITSYESCELCSLRTRKLPCSHTYCYYHAEIQCPACKAPTNLSDLCKLFCQTCYIIKPRSEFIEETCMHQCSNCINLIVGYDFNCRICMNKYEPKIKINQVKCQNCDYFYIRCHLLILDCEHLVCKKCLRMYIDQKKCLLCSKRHYFQDKEIIAITKYLDSLNCFHCQKIIEDSGNYCISCNVNYCEICNNFHALCQKVEIPLYS